MEFKSLDEVINQVNDLIQTPKYPDLCDFLKLIRRYLNLLKTQVATSKEELHQKLEQEQPFSWNEQNLNNNSDNADKDFKQCTELLYYSMVFDDKSIMDTYINGAKLAYKSEVYADNFTKEKKAIAFDDPELAEFYQHLIDLFGSDNS